ncbi:hypothetical protein NEIFLAOT_01227, partial [Neisseria flavescens NRL30031/H210]
PSGVYVYKMDGSFVCKAKVDGNKRAAMPITVRDQLAEKRAKGRIKRAENTIRLAKEETRPAIEQQPDFGFAMHLLTVREDMAIDTQLNAPIMAAA